MHKADVDTFILINHMQFITISITTNMHGYVSTSKQ